MKNLGSYHSFCSESEDGDMEDNRASRDDDDEADSYSSSSSSVASPPQNGANSWNTSWPQSYRQSIDIYGSVASPNIGFLGSPTLSRLGSSFFSNSLTRRHTPEILSNLVKPFLSTPLDQQKPEQFQQPSYHYVPTLPPKKPSLERLPHEKRLVKTSDELPIPCQSSYLQAVINGINVLCGVGILSTPYAAKEGGWIGICILLIFAVFSFYTGLLLRYCLDSEQGLVTYPDIGQAAFGHYGRVAISIILYMELYASCVEYIILESDNLSSLFPNAHINLGLHLNSQNFFSVVTAIAVLPTVWLRDMSILSYISAGGVVASILVFLCLLWVGIVDHVGFRNKGASFNFTGLPVAIGLYGYCYSGHAVFPNIYTSMRNRSQFPAVLFACFIICTILYFGVALMGYSMFGESIKPQFTLNMPQDLIASRIAVWTTVVNPFTKYALTLSPVAMSLEELIPSNPLKSNIFIILIRTGLVFSTLIVALTIPFFGLVLALIGSFLTMLVALILPCACFLSILRGRATKFQVCICVLIIIVGTVSCIVGTVSATWRIVENLT